MTTDSEIDLKAGRRRVARSRGALSGVLLIILGAWAALVPFIGPYFDFGFQPRPEDAWHWTSGRGLYELLPGGVAALAGLLLLISASRVLTVAVAWFAALAGAWLVVAPSLSDVIGVEVGEPGNPGSKANVAAESLLYFFATGAAIVLVAGVALGRLSVHSVRDVRAAERRAETQRLEDERLAAAEAARLDDQRRYDDEQRRLAEQPAASPVDFDKTDSPEQAGPHDTVVAGDGSGRHEADAPAAAHDQPTDDQPTDDQPTRTLPAQQSPYTPPGPRDTAGSTGYLGSRPSGGDDVPAHHQPTTQHPAVTDRDDVTREYPATPQAYPPPPPSSPSEPRNG